MIWDRGGSVLKTGKIGRVNILRQQYMMPGEKMDINMKGNVKLESLRERDSLRINAHLAIFQTPLRWLWPEFPDFVKQGPSTSETVPTMLLGNLSSLGIGADADGINLTVPKFFSDAALRVYNEWYKWPEDNDHTVWDGDGEKAVPLSTIWSRARYDTDPADSDDYTLDAGTSFDIRDLSALQARFKSAMERDVLSYNRYMELMQEMYNTTGSREVDQVPRLIDEVDVGVKPREIPATDGASLGQWQSLFDFNIDHQVKGVVCPEHCILTYALTVRFAPIIEGRAPFSVVPATWQELVGDAEMLSSMPPQDLKVGEFSSNGLTTVVGKVPAGWQWRSGFDVVGKRVDVRDSFPYMLTPTSQAHTKDATRVKSAFRSQSLGDYMVDVHCGERSRSPIGGSLESYFSGMAGGSNKAEFPKGGKMK